MLAKSTSVFVGAWASWGIAQVALAAPVLAQQVGQQDMGSVGGFAIPSSIGALIALLLWQLRESVNREAETRVSCERRITEETKECARQTQLIYESNKSDLARIYQENQELIRAATARQDAANERLFVLLAPKVTQ